MFSRRVSGARRAQPRQQPLGRADARRADRARFALLRDVRLELRNESRGGETSVMKSVGQNFGFETPRPSSSGHGQRFHDTPR